jgi:hypothetical protein
MKYAVLVKNNDESYDILNFINYYDDSTTANLIDSALSDLSNPIIAMDASNHKTTATRGSTWDGNSFSGGIVSKAADATAEELDSFKLYVFLHNNVVIARNAVRTDSPRLEAFEAAFASEVKLVKVPDDQYVAIGETHGWDGSRFI